MYSNNFAHVANNTAYDVPPYLSHIDSLRVCALLEKAIEKLQLLSILSSDASALQVNSITETNTSESEQLNVVAEILEEQRLLGARYEALSQDRNKINESFASIDEQKQREEELARIQEKLKENTRKLCRNLKETPNEQNNWKKVQSERTEIQNNLSNCVRELQNGMLPQSKYKNSKNLQPNQQGHSQRLGVSYELFFRKVMDDTRDRQLLATIQEQELQLSKIVKTLQKEVQNEKELKRYEIEERTQKINELVNQLRELKKMTQEAKSKTEVTDKAEFQCARRQEQIELEKLEQELLEEEMKLRIEEKVYEQTKSFLENTYSTLTQKNGVWKEKSDKEIEEMRQKLSYWEGIREDQINLKNKMEEDYKREVEEMEIRAQVKEARLEQERIDLENQLYDSATKIKLCYRAYKARLLYEALKKEKANKKKKKKKDSKK